MQRILPAFTVYVMQILNLSVASSFIFFSVLHFSFLSSSYVCYGIQVVKAFTGACLRLHGIYPLSFFFSYIKRPLFILPFVARMVSLPHTIHFETYVHMPSTTAVIPFKLPF